MPQPSKSATLAAEKIELYETELDEDLTPWHSNYRQKVVTLIDTAMLPEREAATNLISCLVTIIELTDNKWTKLQLESALAAYREAGK